MIKLNDLRRIFFFKKKASTILALNFGLDFGPDAFYFFFKYQLTHSSLWTKNSKLVFFWIRKFEFNLDIMVY